MQKRQTGPAPHAHGVRNICVYCGSSPGVNPVFTEAARTLGRSLAERGIGLVYGGGGLGLMGEVARATLKHGGRVTGVIPEFLAGPEHAMRDVDELVITASMHERKLQMFERSDAFVALPGGIGTLEEFVEQLTWYQIGRHRKPMVLASVANYWDRFVELLEHMIAAGFIREGLAPRYGVVTRIEDVIPAILREQMETAREGLSGAAISVAPEKF